jgi:hypothetical protein
MKYINEKVAYLKGLSEGMKLAEASDEGKMIGQLLAVLEDICDALDGVTEAHDDLQDYVEMIDDDLTDMEDFLIDIADENIAFEDEDDENDDIYEVECPHCGHVYLADFESFEADDVICPECDTKFSLNEETIERLKQAEDDSHHPEEE